MKEFFATGVVLAGLGLFGTVPAGPESETNRPNAFKQGVSEGFVPHQRVTSPPVRNGFSTDGPLPNFGSEAYL